MTIWQVIGYGVPLVIGVTGGIAYSMAITWRRRANLAMDRADSYLEQLDLMTAAHDPGRDVHERLARVIEASLVKNHGGPDPAGRRTAAMGVAEAMLTAITSAGLEVVVKEPAE